jgi:hypothetical protein
MVYDGVSIEPKRSATDPDSFIVHVDGHALVWALATDTEPRHTEVILIASTFDKKGNELKRDAKVIKIAAPASAPPTGRYLHDINIPCKIDHNPKAVRARFSLRVSATGRIGTADLPLGEEAGKAAPAQ